MHRVSPAPVVPLRTLPRLTRRLRQQGKTVVTLNGSFDLIHAGHLAILEAAAQQGDVLIVGVNSDASVRRYKSPDRPIIPLRYRLTLLSQLRMIDYLTVFSETTPLRFLRLVRPDVHVNGAEYGRKCVEAPFLKTIGAKLILVRRRPKFATSVIIRKIRSLPVL